MPEAEDLGCGLIEASTGGAQSRGVPRESPEWSSDLPKVTQHNIRAGLMGLSSPGTTSWSKGVVKEKEGACVFQAKRDSSHLAITSSGQDAVAPEDRLRPP